jgi:hypothetical protein
VVSRRQNFDLFEQATSSPAGSPLGLLTFFNMLTYGDSRSRVSLTRQSRLHSVDPGGTPGQHDAGPSGATVTLDSQEQVALLTLSLPAKVVRQCSLLTSIASSTSRCEQIKADLPFCSSDVAAWCCFTLEGDATLSSRASHDPATLVAVYKVRLCAVCMGFACAQPELEPSCAPCLQRGLCQGITPGRVVFTGRSNAVMRFGLEASPAPLTSKLRSLTTLQYRTC